MDGITEQMGNELPSGAIHSHYMLSVPELMIVLIAAIVVIDAVHAIWRANSYDYLLDNPSVVNLIICIPIILVLSAIAASCRSVSAIQVLAASSTPPVVQDIIGALYMPVIAMGWPLTIVVIDLCALLYTNHRMSTSADNECLGRMALSEQTPQ